jgi:hypothetical protein
VNGGHCLVAWDEVTTHKCFGGLGIPYLHLLNLALCCRWAWLQWTDPTKEWAKFDLHLGSGERAGFWRDRWLDGSKVSYITPNLVALIPPHKTKVRTVKEGLSSTWLQDCCPNLGEAALAEFFILWQVLAVVQLMPKREDSLR